MAARDLTPEAIAADVADVPLLDPSAGLVPPHDEHAEQVVLSAVLTDPDTHAATMPAPAEFYSAAHQAIARAIVEMRLQGTPVELPTVAVFLRERGTLAAAGGAQYLGTLVHDLPSIGGVSALAEVIRTRYRQRRVGEVARRMLVEAYTTNEPERWLDRVTETIRVAAEPAGSESPRIEWLGADGISAPLPDHPWRVEGLQIAEGRPTMFAGYGGSGKTFAAMAALLAYAAGRPVWDAKEHTFRSHGPGGPVTHWNWDQGGHATRGRYQALALGMGIDWADVGSRLRLVNRPTVTLLDPKALDVLIRESEGVDIAMIDAMRGATAGADENESSFRRYMDLIATVSERTGTSFLVMHHTKKRTAERSEDPRELLRGSSAILDGSGAVWLMEGTGKEPRKVSHVRQHEMSLGDPSDPFHLELVKENGGVRVVHRLASELADAKAESSEDLRTLWGFILRNPGCSHHEMSSANLRIGKDRLRGLLDTLERLERITIEREGRRHAHRANPWPDSAAH